MESSFVSRLLINGLLLTIQIQHFQFPQICVEMALYEQLKGYGMIGKLTFVALEWLEHSIYNYRLNACHFFFSIFGTLNFLNAWAWSFLLLMMIRNSRWKKIIFYSQYIFCSSFFALLSMCISNRDIYSGYLFLFLRSYELALNSYFVRLDSWPLKLARSYTWKNYYMVNLPYLEEAWIIWDV